MQIFDAFFEVLFIGWKHLRVRFLKQSGMKSTTTTKNNNDNDNNNKLFGTSSRVVLATVCWRGGRKVSSGTPIATSTFGTSIRRTSSCAASR
eukprot:5203150-Amphidinium_carterae.1